jgi:hypothetical protein
MQRQVPSGQIRGYPRRTELARFPQSSVRPRRYRRRSDRGAAGRWPRNHAASDRKCRVSNRSLPEVLERVGRKGSDATCLDQYNANKATNANGGLKWIQKGGGYYSECNKQLKG